MRRTVIPVVLALGAPAVLPALAPPAADAAKAKARQCKKGQVRIATRGARARCVKVSTLAKGLPRGRTRLLGSLATGSRIPASTKGSIAARLGRGLPAIAAWEARLVAAGQAAAARTAGATARAAQSPGTENDLGLELVGPLGWAQSAAEFIKSVKEGQGGIRDTGRDQETKGKLIKVGGESYEFSVAEGGEPKLFCPNAKGVVKASGVLKVRRTYTPPGTQVPVVEQLTIEYTITGYVDKKATLTKYDVDVKVIGTGGGAGGTTTGSAKGVKPRATGIPIIAGDAIRIGGASGRDRLVATAIAYAQEEGLKFVQDAENRFNREASCLTTEQKPAKVKPGTQQEVTIKVISRITGKQVDSDLTLQPSGGAEVTPTTTTTTPSKPARVKVKMPAKGKGSSVRARAAASASVGITGLSEQGRAVGTIGPDGLPERFTGTIRAETTNPVERVTWTSDVTYTVAESAGHPDGSATARYRLSAASVTSFTDLAGDCPHKATGTRGQIRFGDLELQIAAGGAVTYGFVHDVGLPGLSYVPQGPIPPCAPGYSGLGVAFLNARTATNALRPGPADLHLVQAPTPDVSVPPFSSATASWELLPG